LKAVLPPLCKKLSGNGWTDLPELPEDLFHHVKKSGGIIQVHAIGISPANIPLRPLLFPGSLS
jgi:hypothetical protein